MTPCDVENCDQPVHGRGLCNKHHLRMLRYGQPVPDHLAAKEAITAIGEKACRECREVKSHAAFKPSTYTKDGRNGKCRSCTSARSRELYRLNGKVASIPWVDRFLARYEVHSGSGCWNWTAGLTPHGYGRLRVDGETWQSHRLSYALHYGDLPSGALICHHCDNRRCVNPQHLYAGTAKTNADDSVQRGRRRPRRGEQVQTHILTEAEIPQIRSMWNAGVPQRWIAKEFQVSPSCIYAVIHGRSWRHVP